MSLLEASLVAADYANIEPEAPFEAPEKSEQQQQTLKEEFAITTGKISEKAESASLEDDIDSAMKIKKRPSSKVPSDIAISDELEEEKEDVQF